MEKCGRPQLPPSDDPKVQARREKARANASKKRDVVKKGKAGSTIAGAIKRKLAVKPVDDSKAKATAGSTIAGAIKRKLAGDDKKARATAGSTLAGAIKRKLAPAKPIAQNPAGGMTKGGNAPVKNDKDTNLLHNIPEDLQKKIMTMARDKWTSNTFEMCDEALFHLMLGYELSVNKKIHHKRNRVEGWYDEVYLPNWKDNYITNFMKEYLPDEYAKIKTKSPKKENDSDVNWNGAKLYVKWIDEDNATPELFEKMMRRKDMRHELTLQELKNQSLRKDIYIAMRGGENHRYKGTIQQRKKKGVVVWEGLWRGAIMYGMKLTDKEGNFKDDVVLMFDVADIGEHTGDPDRKLAMSYFTDGKYHLDRGRKGVKCEYIDYKLK